MVSLDRLEVGGAVERVPDGALSFWGVRRLGLGGHEVGKGGANGEVLAPTDQLPSPSVHVGPDEPGVADGRLVSVAETVHERPSVLQDALNGWGWAVG